MMPSLKATDIRDNFLRIKDRIAKAARNAGRDPDGIQLVVVTKTHPVEVIQAVIEAGATDIGENYVDEAVPKIESLSQYTSLTWHMVGHVQSRKAQAVCEYFHYLHSLDSVKLAERLSRFTTVFEKTLPVFLELNVSGEASKSGWDVWVEENWSNILIDIKAILTLDRLDVLGLMTIPPFSIDPEASRSYYRRLRDFQEYAIDKLQLTGFRQLSIGMSSDFEVAIQEGSTCVRIGQAILGPRPA